MPRVERTKKKTKTEIRYKLNLLFVLVYRIGNILIRDDFYLDF